MRLSNSNPGVLILLVFCLIAGCGGTGEVDLGQLEGYWEIRKVEFPDGNNKEYLSNSTVDYFELEGLRGYRKKLQPEPDGTFSTSDDALPLEVRMRDGRIFLQYEGEQETWEDEILELDAGTLILRDPLSLRYEYARYETLSKTEANGP